MRQPECADRDGGPDKAPRETNTLQTLDRGLQTLTLVSQQENGLSIAELAERLAVHRAIAYRLVTTLEGHGLVARVGGQIRLGAGLMTLSSRFEPQLRSVAGPLLSELAEQTQAAAFIAMPQGGECVAIMVAEPAGGVLRIAYRVGSRHPLTRGAAGIAILAGRAERRGELDAVRQARREGVSVTRDQLQRGAVGVASPVHTPAHDPSGFEASLGVVALEALDLARATAAVISHAGRLADLVGAGRNR